MAASQVIEDNRNADNQARANGIKKNTLLTNTPRPSPSSTQRFQEVTKQIISESTPPGPSVGTHHNAPNLPTSTGKYRRNSLAAVVVSATADDMNRRNSHYTTSSSTTKHDDGSHSAASNSNGSSHPSSSSNKPKYGSSHPTSSSNAVIHGFSHPTSSNSKLHGQSASRKLANTSTDTRKSRTDQRKGIASIAETHTRSNAETKDLATRHRSGQFCKDCRESIMESVCFITNDGRISAAITGAAYIRHFHHCNVPGCAGNRSCNPSPVPLSKKALLSKRQVPRPTRATTPHTLSGRGDRRSICSSATSSMQGDDWSTHEGKQELNQKEVFHKEDESQLANIDTDYHRNVCINQTGLDGFSPCRDHPHPLSMHATEDEQSYGENSLVEAVEVRSTRATSCASSDIHDDDDAKVFVNTDAMEELNDFKSHLYHGDNEYSCSEDGTEATATPNSSIKGAFDDLSNIDIEQSGCKNKASAHQRRLTMARMRQKYLESLQEQEAETIRLRKQEIMARKQAGDWMLDSHMEEVLHRLAPNGEAHVKVLVEAYETVIHHSDSDGSQTHRQDHNLHGQEHGDNLHSYASC